MPALEACWRKPADAEMLVACLDAVYQGATWMDDGVVSALDAAECGELRIRS